MMFLKVPWECARSKCPQRGSAVQGSVARAVVKASCVYKRRRLRTDDEPKSSGQRPRNLLRTRPERVCYLHACAGSDRLQHCAVVWPLTAMSPPPAHTSLRSARQILPHDLRMPRSNS